MTTKTLEVYETVQVALEDGTSYEQEIAVQKTYINGKIVKSEKMFSVPCGKDTMIFLTKDEYMAI